MEYRTHITTTRLPNTNLIRPRRTIDSRTQTIFWKHGPLGCNYETRSSVGNGKMPCTVPQHPIMHLGLCNLPPVIYRKRSGELPFDDNHPCSPPPPLIYGPFWPLEDVADVAVPSVVEEGEHRNRDCPCQDQTQNTSTSTLPSPRHSPEIPQEAVVLHPLFTKQVGARLSLFCGTWRQKGYNLLAFGFRLCFREKSPMTLPLHTLWTSVPS